MRIRPKSWDLVTDEHLLMSTTRPAVVYDANVLYPAHLRDLLMRLAVGDLVQAH